MAKKSIGRTKASQRKIPPEQLDLPVSFNPAGNPVTLREVLQSGHGAVLSPASLSPEKRAEITIRRIEAQPRFELAMIGGGMIDKNRAIEEVKAQSDIGKVLMEIEQRVINNLLERIPHKKKVPSAR